ACLFYRDRWYSLGNLAPGEQRPIDNLFDQGARGQNRQVNSWFGDSTLSPGIPLAPTGRPVDANFQSGRSAFRLMKSLMFYQVSDTKALLNAGLRRFDQSWRLPPLTVYPTPREQRYRSEAILVARAPMLVDRAEAVTEHEASPSRLWLRALPADGGSR